MIRRKVWIIYSKKSLTAWEKLYGAEPSERSFSLRFAGIIERACKQAGQRVVILVDEYDKPMLQAIGNEKIAKTIPGHFKTFLWGTQNNGWLYKVCVLDRRLQSLAKSVCLAT